MQSLIHLVILLMLLAVVVSLGTALYHLARGPRDGEDSNKMFVALAIRVGLSLALFFLIMIAWYFGLIAPHGLPAR
ncbi:MAG: twin transmembrane helix small protein [Steroidobacteraceae bacterium]